VTVSTGSEGAAGEAARRADAVLVCLVAAFSEVGVQDSVSTEGAAVRGARKIVDPVAIVAPLSQVEDPVSAPRSLAVRAAGVGSFVGVEHALVAVLTRIQHAVAAEGFVLSTIPAAAVSALLIAVVAYLVTADVAIPAEIRGAVILARAWRDPVPRPIIAGLARVLDPITAVGQEAVRAAGARNGVAVEGPIVALLPWIERSIAAISPRLGIGGVVLVAIAWRVAASKNEER
jgi:hypothetical protein